MRHVTKPLHESRDENSFAGYWHLPPLALSTLALYTLALSTLALYTLALYMLALYMLALCLSLSLCAHLTSPDPAHITTHPSPLTSHPR